MNINRSNYEVYFLDYLEGTLSLEEVDKLLLFMEQNPDLKEELEGLENISLPPETGLLFENKDSLKKNMITPVAVINAKNYEMFFAADWEGDLTLQEKTALKEFLLKNPENKPEYDLFRHTKIVPDKTIVFEGKRKLKKFTIGGLETKQIYRISAIAASFLLLIGLYLTIDRPFSGNNFKKEVAVKTTEQPANIIKSTDNPPNNNQASVKPVKAIHESKAYANNLQQKTNNTEPTKSIEVEPTTAPRKDFHLSAMPAMASGKLNLKEANHFGYDFGFRNYYTAVFFDLQMAGTIQYNQSLAARQKKTKSPVEYAILKMKTLFTGKDAEDISAEQRITFWDLAHASLKGFNVVTGSNYQLNREQDAEGNILVTGFTGNEVGIYNAKQQ